MTLIDILLVILLIASSLLCIALMVNLFRITDAIRALRKDADEILTSLKPLIISSKELTDNLNQISDSAKHQLDITESMVSDVRDRVDKVLEVESKIRNGVEDSVMPLINNLQAISKGVNVFWSRYKREG